MESEETRSRAIQRLLTQTRARTHTLTLLGRLANKHNQQIARLLQCSKMTPSSTADEQQTTQPPSTLFTAPFVPYKLCKAQKKRMTSHRYHHHQHNRGPHQSKHNHLAPRRVGLDVQCVRAYNHLRHQQCTGGCGCCAMACWGNIPHGLSSRGSTSSGRTPSGSPIATNTAVPAGPQPAVQSLSA